MWTRRSTAGAWYVTAISIDWCLGAVLYYAVPSLGPVYSSPEWFARLPRTPNTSVSEMLLADRIEVLAGPWDTGTVQTIAAFASLHVAVMVTICLMAEQMRLPALIRVAAWAFLALTCVATVYLGWHFFVDVLAGFARRRRGLRAGGQGHRQPAAPSRGTVDVPRRARRVARGRGPPRPTRLELTVLTGRRGPPAAARRTPLPRRRRTSCGARRSRAARRPWCAGRRGGGGAGRTG